MKWRQYETRRYETTVRGKLKPAVLCGNSVGYHGTPWNTMEYHGISWNTMEYHGISSIAINCLMLFVCKYQILWSHLTITESYYTTWKM